MSSLSDDRNQYVDVKNVINQYGKSLPKTCSLTSKKALLKAGGTEYGMNRPRDGIRHPLMTELFEQSIRDEARTQSMRRQAVSALDDLVKEEHGCEGIGC